MKKFEYKVDQKETQELPENSWALGYFQSSHENWDGKTWVRNLTELRIRDMALFSLGDVKDKKVLDLGCGYGEYMLTLAKMGAKVSGQDISQECTEKARTVLKKEGHDPDLKTGCATKLLFEDNYFDAVFSADFFEHIDRDQKNKVVAEVYRVLKPGGVFSIKTPNLVYLRLTLLLKRVSAFMKFKWPFNINIAHTKNNPDGQHIGLTTHKELTDILISNKFHYPQITYMRLIREKMPEFLTEYLYGKKLFTETIIIAARKPLFYGFY